MKPKKLDALNFSNALLCGEADNLVCGKTITDISFDDDNRASSNMKGQNRWNLWKYFASNSGIHMKQNNKVRFALNCVYSGNFMFSLCS